MPTITTTDGIEIFCKDWGSGQPIVFSHGWPLSSDDWDNQMRFFLQHGYRVIGHSTGAGEVVRSIARHAESRVARAVPISAVPPLIVQARVAA